MKVAAFNRLWDSRKPLSLRSFESLTTAEFIKAFGEASTSNPSYAKAIGISAYWAAIKTISENIASVEFRIMQKEGPRYRIAYDHPLTELLRYGPNQLQTKFNFFELMMHDLLVFGNSYHEIGFNGNGTIAALEPLSPTKTKLKKIPRNLRELGEFPYIYENSEDGELLKRRIHSQDVFHVVGFGASPISGHSTLKTFGETLGMTISVNKYGKGFFDRSGMPSGVLSSNNEDLDPDEVDSIKESWNEAHGPGNSQGTAFLWGGFKYSPISVNPEHAQFNATRITMVREVARMFNIPTTKLRDTERSTYSNVEQEAIDFVLETLTPWARRLEAHINKKLLRIPVGDFSARFVLGSLLMGDIRTRFRAYEVALVNGFMTIAEVRELEGFPTRPVGMSEDMKAPAKDNDNNQKNSVDTLRILDQLEELREIVENSKNGHVQESVLS